MRLFDINLMPNGPLTRKKLTQQINALNEELLNNKSPVEKVFINKFLNKSCHDALKALNIKKNQYNKTETLINNLEQLNKASCDLSQSVIESHYFEGKHDFYVMDLFLENSLSLEPKLKKLASSLEAAKAENKLTTDAIKSLNLIIKIKNLSSLLDSLPEQDQELGSNSARVS